ncbi:MAG: 2-phosphosulfolactate phosphatase [Cyclobacteriaceae bacterium]
MDRKIEVCLSPELIDSYETIGKVVIVADIFRATSCMAVALAHGVKLIKPVASLSDCKKLQDEGYIAAAERGGQKVDGFDLGNSPFSYMDESLKDRSIAMTTTNGTMALHRAVNAKQVIAGSFLNFSPLVNYLKKIRFDVLVLCAGWKGKVNLEDTLYAGALVDALKASCRYGGDAALMSHLLYNNAKNDLPGFLEDADHTHRLVRLGQEEDIAFCLKKDMYTEIPVLRKGSLYKLTLSDMLLGM